MKAPDKIYLDIRYNNDEYPIEVFATRALASDVEYICKDALLEWAKDTLKLAVNTSPLTDDSILGYRQGIKALIDKLERL